MSTLTQCTLEEVDGPGILTTWIPTKGARVGTTMTVEGMGECRWEVRAVYDTMDEAYIKERGRDYRNTRKMSDV